MVHRSASRSEVAFAQDRPASLAQAMKISAGFARSQSGT